MGDSLRRMKSLAGTFGFMGKREPQGFIGERLDHLFETVRREDGKRYTLVQVANAINAAAGERLGSAAYIQQLRVGDSDNPTYKVIVGLSRFFGVSPMYFFEEADLERGMVPPEVALAVADEDVREIAVDAAGLSKQSLESVKQLIANARALEERPAPRTRSRKSNSE